MAVTTTPVFAQTPKTSTTSLAAASAWTPSVNSTTNMQTLVTAGANGSRVLSILFATTDTTANNVFLVLDPGGAGTALAIIGQINVPIGAGTVASTLTVDALLPSVTVGLPIDNNGKRYIELAASDKIWIGVVANMTAAKTLFAAAIREDY